jgi:8-oxo-dGTP diphosphatase
MLHEVALDRPDQGIHWSASCHNVSDLRRAASIGCRFAYLSSVRATFSHPGLAAKGWWEFSKMVKMARIPVYALGGINRNDLTAARYQGASGVAGIRDFWSA